MKKHFIILIFFLLAAKLYSQEYYVLTFSGSGATPETVLVENQTKGTSVNIQGTDELHLNLVTSNIGEISVENDKLFVYPNPMEHSCKFEFSNKRNGRVNICLYDISGKMIHNYSRVLADGLHTFSMSGVASGSYVISVKTETDYYTGRFVSLDDSKNEFVLVHEGSKNSSSSVGNNDLAETNDMMSEKGTKAIVDMDFTIGDQLKIIGYADGFANSTVYISPTSDQSVSFNFEAPFYRITGHSVVSDVPCFVNVMFTVADLNYVGVDNLSNENFIVKEDGVVVSPSESFRYVRSINTVPYRIKTVLMIDNSSSIINELDEIKQAALTMVNNIGENQEIAIYSFSDGPVLLQNFTSDVDLLTQAINGITLGFPSTNLYGSYIAGVNAWSDIFSASLIQKGFLVLFTDGDDTQGSSTLTQAIAARGQKSTYIIGLGDDLTPDVLNQLANPSPYYPASTVDDLPQIFEDIQNDIYIYANSFYWLNYMTPKRGGLHTLKIEIAENENIGTDSYYEGQFNANGFESVTYGVYVNTTSSDLYGIDELSLSNYNPVDLTAVTYWAYAPPQYTWTSDNTDIVTVNPDDEFFNKAELNFAGISGSTVITVNDVANSYTKNVNIVVQGPPTVSTGSVTDISYTSARCDGNVTSDGGLTVTAKGVCWSTSQNPVVSGSHTSDGTGTGTFLSTMTGLTDNTTYYVRAYATNSLGTSYGAQQSFSTQVYGMPIVSTTAISEISYNTASSGGNVTADGGTAVTAKGVCWSTNQNPTTADSHTTDGSGTGYFVSSLTSLTAGSTYYVRAYATNGEGTSYGNQVSFSTTAYSVPTVTTTEVSSITYTTASSGGNVTSTGGQNVTARGVCWSTNQNPIASDAHTTNGTGTGTFTSSLTALTPGTTYYIRAYATNSQGTGYGEQLSFTAQAYTVPVITTTAISAITYTTASSGGNVTATGGQNVTTRGVCWSTSQNPTATDAHTTNGTGTGTFTSNLTALTPGTTYYVRAYATNSQGTGYGEQLSFTTQAYYAPTVTTTAISAITYTTASSGGNVTATGGQNVTARGVCWSTNENPTIADSYTSNGTGTGSFTSSLTGLTAGTTYYLRAYATNSVGTGYGEQISFYTQEYTLPVVVTNSIVDIGVTTVIAGGTVDSDGGDILTTRGVCWDIVSNPDISDSKTVDGIGVGTYSSNLTNLNQGTTYYVRAYATNSAGTAYGQQLSFTTETCGENISFTYNGSSVTYGTVVSSGKCWLDRNLGASQVASSSSDNLSYGDLFQWGRLIDGHQLLTSGITATLSSTNVPGHSNFIKVSTNPYDWRSPQNSDLWQGVNGVNNPCPTGFRLPTNTEWLAEKQSWGSNVNAQGAISSPLKLPLGSYRDRSDGSFASSSSGTVGYYWSGTFGTGDAKSFSITATNASNSSAFRAYGYSVRCIKD